MMAASQACVMAATNVACVLPHACRMCLEGNGLPLYSGYTKMMHNTIDKEVGAPWHVRAPGHECGVAMRESFGHAWCGAAMEA